MIPEVDFPTIPSEDIWALQKINFFIPLYAGIFRRAH